jgi:hypothetical protein
VISFLEDVGAVLALTLFISLIALIAMLAAGG